MSKNKVTVYHSYLPIGTKFEVTDKLKNAKYPPGSIGFIVHTSRTPKHRAWAQHRVAIIKRGKTGKARIELTNLNTPSYYEDKRGDKLEMAYGLGKFEDSGLVEIAPFNFASKNVMGMLPLDFIGWATAYAGFLHFIRHNYVDLDKMWPKSQKHPLNIFYRMNHYAPVMDKNPEQFFQDYANAEMRTGFLLESRAKELHMFQCIELYREQQKHNQERALLYLEERLNKRTLLAKHLRELRESI